jgi:integrase
MTTPPFDVGDVREPPREPAGRETVHPPDPLAAIRMPLLLTRAERTSAAYPRNRRLSRPPCGGKLDASTLPAPIGLLTRADVRHAAAAGERIKVSRDDYPYNERSGPATTAGFLKIIARTGEAAKLPFPIHPHMLRHSTGYKLANDGHDTRALQHYMGHKNIMHTVRYTEMAPDRFKNFWKD